MANFKQHISGGIIFGILCTLTSFFVMGFTVVNSLTVFILGVLGSILPDVDCDSSTPNHLLFEVMGLLIPVLFLNRFLSNLSVENILFFLIVGYIVTKYALKFIFNKFTVHRGVVHSIPAAIIVGGIVFLGFGETSFSLKVIYAMACAGGFIVHLVMDEIWSVDLGNNRLKNSFGTALTLWSGSIISTVAAYVVIVAMGLLIYSSTTIPKSLDISEGQTSAVPRLEGKTLQKMGWADRFLVDINSTWTSLLNRYVKN
ncbi:metal-dependent hydrolase [Lentisphaerota bacterium ZTH]|nr:metal-dependent hydrolase [Lentisphaerota bacterium]WET07318.1 metal-dependent hydrolase [Lentisphaerota bacterium ZTH]